MIINKVEIDFNYKSTQADNKLMYVIGNIHNNWRETTIASHAASADESRILINIYIYIVT